MPLLNKKPLELHRYNRKLKDDAEVFYCKCTNEIFEDYEEYCQRVITCNSLIWSCAMTGKSNLTYEEALASEQNALKSIKDFPSELRTPVLYLASRTSRRNFNEMAGDVFGFAKDRYFVGESVEVSVEGGGGGGWVCGQVLQVVPPEEGEVEEYRRERKMGGAARPGGPHPSGLYRYEVELLTDESEEVSEVRVVPGEKVRRSKGLYSKEKNRVYLRQFVEFKKDRWRIQNKILAKYSILSVKFSEMFAGEPPEFGEDGGGGEGRYSQGTINAYLSREKEKEKGRGRGKGDLKDIHKKYETTIDKVVEQARRELTKKEDKARKLEEVRRKRKEEKEEKARLATFVKEWQRKREDLECEDLKALPEGCPVDCRVPNEYFGDAVMILEFLSSFREVLKVKDYFPLGLRFEVLERALVEVEIAGPFTDILQMLLTSLFTLQEQEDDEIRSTDLHRMSELEVDECGDMTTAEAIKLATIATSWSQVHHGVPLSQLSLDPIAVSEVLRLHLLASGGRAGERSAKWRYQERGGYTSTDDPCLGLRLKEPHILRFLSVKSVAELGIGDKIKVVSCLMNQILTYAELRDIIEERYERMKAARNELKNDQVAESRKEKELSAQRVKERKEGKGRGKGGEEWEVQRQREERESNRKKAEFQRRRVELQKAAMDCQITPLGEDRGYRKFWMFTTLGGLFVEEREEFPGGCLPEPTPRSREVSAEEDTMSYVRKLFEEERNCGSDKENEGNASHPVTSPKKKLLSESNELSSLVKAMGVPVKEGEGEEEGEGEWGEKVGKWVCTGDEDTCPVHRRRSRSQWAFYYKENEIEELIECLNKRGYREHRLKKALMEAKDNIIPRLGQCPVRQLNRFSVGLGGISATVKQTRSQKGYENANLKYPAGTPVQEILELYMRELILDTEEKIYCGGLGTLKVRNRKAWREALRCRSYDRQDEGLTWRQYPISKEKKEEDISRPDTPCSLDSSPEQYVLAAKTDQNQVVKDLSCAVLQIARSVEPKYLQKPLLEERKKEKATAMERWELSLMSSTSFAQVYLHVATLENSIQWSKSALNARCKVCRRGGDGENMLLCDSCNRGFHLYCLKPKLTSIPKGDWFCVRCRPKEKVEKTKRSRKLFSEESDEEDNQPLASTRLRSTRSEDVSRKRKLRKPDCDDDDDDDSGDEPLSKIARTARRSTQKRDVE